MNIVTTISTFIKSSKWRIVKAYHRGISDVRTGYEIGPFGFDSNPIEGMKAIYSRTSVNGRPVIVGYINKNQAVNPGESRMYSVDEDGAVLIFVKCNDEGKILLGGEADNAVRYAALDQQLQGLITTLNAQLALIATGIATGGGSYSPATLTLDLTTAKINEILTP